jgi:hypothetical protein
LLEISGLCTFSFWGSVAATLKLERMHSR